MTVWHRAADGADVSALHAEIALFAASQKGPVGLLLVVPPGLPLSSQSARQAAAEMVRSLSSSCVAIAVVVEGSGFGTAAIRAMFTGLGLLARPGFPWQIFSESSSAIPWLLHQFAVAETTGPSAQDALAALELMRRAREDLGASVE